MFLVSLLNPMSVITFPCIPEGRQEGEEEVKKAEPPLHSYLPWGKIESLPMSTSLIRISLEGDAFQHPELPKRLDVRPRWLGEPWAIQAHPLQRNDYS